MQTDDTKTSFQEWWDKDDDEIIESVVKVLSAKFFFNRYRSSPLWFLLDTWKNKVEWRQRPGISETEKATAWQSMMAIRKILMERGQWNNVKHVPCEFSEVVWTNANSYPHDGDPWLE